MVAQESSRAEELFQAELERVMSRLGRMSPSSPVGTIYKVTRNTTIRRILLSRAQQHIYYSIDERSETVIVRTIWVPDAVA